MQQVDRCGRGGRIRWILITFTMCAAAFSGWLAPQPARLDAQSTAPEMLVPNLAVHTVVSGLVTPISLAFLTTNDLLVLEKDTGRVRRVVNGSPQATELDLAVNSAPSVDCSASRYIRTSPRDRGSICIGPRARPAPIPTSLPTRRCSATASTATCGTDRL